MRKPYLQLVSNILLCLNIFSKKCVYTYAYCEFLCGISLFLCVWFSNQICTHTSMQIIKPCEYRLCIVSNIVYIPENICIILWTIQVIYCFIYSVVVKQITFRQ